MNYKNLIAENFNPDPEWEIYEEIYTHSHMNYYEMNLKNRVNLKSEGNCIIDRIELIFKKNGDNILIIKIVSHWFSPKEWKKHTMYKIMNFLEDFIAKEISYNKISMSMDYVANTFALEIKSKYDLKKVIKVINKIDPLDKIATHALLYTFNEKNLIKEEMAIVEKVHTGKYKIISYGFAKDDHPFKNKLSEKDIELSWEIMDEDDNMIYFGKSLLKKFFSDGYISILEICKGNKLFGWNGNKIKFESGYPGYNFSNIKSKIIGQESILDAFKYCAGSAQLYKKVYEDNK